MSKPFCDRLTVTCPKSHDAALADVCREFSLQLDGVPEGPEGRWLLPGGGTFFYQSRGRFAALEASGRALASLRATEVFGDYLTSLGVLPHRVTRLDAALDLPMRAAPFLHDLYKRGVHGEVHLGRKAVPRSEVVKYFGAALYPGEDLDTGTVYVPMRRFGLKRQYLTGYDKRQERLSRGYPDPGHLLRLEASAARQKGATLADAWDPESLFYDIVSPTVLAAPEGVPAWVPSEESWSAGPVVSLPASRRLERYLEGPVGVELLRLMGAAGGPGSLLRWVSSHYPGVGAAGFHTA